MNTKAFVGVRFDPELHRELKRASRQTNIPMSQFVREATALYIKTLEGRTHEAQRKLLTSEYLALAIDLIISTEYPADRDKLLLEAGRRVEGIDATA